MKVACLPFKLPESGVPVYTFQVKHVPKPACYPHSEIWCNQVGEIESPYECPPKQIRISMRVKLATCLSLHVE